MALNNEQKFHRLYELAERYLDIKLSDIPGKLLDYRLADPGWVKNVRRVRDFITNPGRNIWHEHTITRDGKETVAIQVLANAETLGLENKAAIAALTALVGQLATGQDVDYERIKQDTANVIEAGVTVTVNVPTTKEQP